MKTKKSSQRKVYVIKRRGKFITIVSGLHTYGYDRLNLIAKELKSMLGAGGTVKNGIIEIQGNKVEQIKEWFKSDNANKTKTSA